MTRRRPRERRPVDRTETTFHLPKKKIITPMRVVIFLIIFGIITVTFISLSSSSSVFAAKLTDTGGHSFSIDDYKGKVVLLDFMFSQCPGCKLETPELVKVDQAYGSSIFMVSLSVWEFETDATLAAFKSSYGAGWSFAIDTAGITQNQQITVLPTIIILDKQGSVSFRGSVTATGPVTASTIENTINLLQ